MKKIANFQFFSKSILASYNVIHGIWDIFWGPENVFEYLLRFFTQEVTYTFNFREDPKNRKNPKNYDFDKKLTLGIHGR